MAKKRIKVSDGVEELTFSEVVGEFVEYKYSQNLTERSISSYTDTIKKFQEYTKIELIHEIDEGTIIKWKNSMLKQDISYNTVNHDIRNIKAFLRFCEKRNYLPHIDIAEVKGQETRIKYYTEQEMDLLLEKPTGSVNYGKWRTWACICFIYSTGARAQSVCDVKMEDLDFYHEQITFTHQKNKTLLVLPMSEALEKVLREYIRKCHIENETYLFPLISGEQMSPHILNVSIARYCEERKVQNRGTHAIRHAFASQAIRNGMNPLKLQKILNHSSFKQTERYLHLFGEDLKVDYEDYSPLDVATKKKSRSKRVGKEER